MVSSIEVVFFTDLKNFELEEQGFNDVSYGDAEYTLVYAETLIDELENRDDMTLEPLIEELRAVPENVFVALRG